MYFRICRIPLHSSSHPVYCQINGKWIDQLPHKVKSLHYDGPVSCDRANRLRTARSNQEIFRVLPHSGMQSAIDPGQTDEKSICCRSESLPWRKNAEEQATQDGHSRLVPTRGPGHCRRHLETCLFFAIVGMTPVWFSADQPWINLYINVQ